MTKTLSRDSAPKKKTWAEIMADLPVSICITLSLKTYLYSREHTLLSILSQEKHRIIDLLRRLLFLFSAIYILHMNEVSIVDLAVITSVAPNSEYVITSVENGRCGREPSRRHAWLIWAGVAGGRSPSLIGS